MKRILMVIPFEAVYPPVNGGMLRCFNLLNQLCRHFSVTAIMHQDVDSFMESANEFPAISNCRVISTKDNNHTKDIFSLLPARLEQALRYRYWNRSLQGPASSHFLALYQPLKMVLQTSEIDCVLIEDMEILNLSKLVNRYQPNVPVIYDAYNVNTVLAAASLRKKEISADLFAVIKRTESTLFKYVNKVFTCSENDLIALRDMNQQKINGTVVPNGVVMPEGKTVDNNKSETRGHDILFCGNMDYSPNREGLKWFLEDVFPLVLQQEPKARLMLVGKGNPGPQVTPLLTHPSVLNYGRVDKVDVYYYRAALAVVPLLSGSGTRLKLLEAMAYKSPIVSTATGAEGIDYTDGINILIADKPDAFAGRVVSLLRNPSMAESIASGAFDFVQQHYDWNIIGNNMAAYLQSLQN